ncbi:MAG: hypothetical protein EXS10_06875 [Phycisphaerales bacterium]|nr:hypothetical protein [Phycisphaerales bacterium]
MLRIARSLLLCVVSLLALDASAHAQSCPFYATAFNSFSDPPNFTQGAMSVQWCLDGASVTTSNWCPDGYSLRFDASSEDPVILISTGASGCSAIEVSFKYAQFAASGSIVRYGLSSATTVSCTASTSNTLGALLVTGGACTPVTYTIPLGSSASVHLRFDHGVNSNAILLDDFQVRLVGCCGTHECCVAGAAGCSDNAVAKCVCAQDPYCCATGWDAQCVSEVELFGCGNCSGGGGGEPCLVSGATDFGTLFMGGSICTLEPELFDSCEGLGPYLTSSFGCGGSLDMAMQFGSGFPYSAAISKCFAFGPNTSPSLRFKYSKQAGTLGPRVDVSIASGSWSTLWQATSAGVSCTSVELLLPSLANESDVRFRFASASSVSNGSTFDDIEVIANTPIPHACCAEGAPSCTDSVVALCTCVIDAFCCTTAWDAACVAEATIYCGALCPGLPVCGSPTAGSCFVARVLPACADAECCLTVCTLDGFCCDNDWDALCVQEAHAWCAPQADFDGDGIVGAKDLAILLAQWGGSGSADLDASGTVDAEDLAAFLHAWGL